MSIHREILVCHTLAVGYKGGAWLSFKEWWGFMDAQQEFKDNTSALHQIVCILWQFWMFRNDLVLGDAGYQCEQAIRNGIKLAKEYQEGNARGDEGGRRLRRDKLGRGQPRWCTPTSGFVKVNCDGAYSAPVFIGRLYKDMGKATSSLLVEALAVKDGLKFAIELGYRKLEIESDSKYLVQILNVKGNIPMKIDVVITDVHHWSANMSVKFMFTRRNNNNAAHKLVHCNSRLEQEASRLIVPPHWLVSILIEDCNI
ncbi:hypothetical protein LIER_14723 [Lithospermum erythrorhizon]|uniref:RNase H type-1 domain-containing protein n=1 Tax=Lithospermum erythrorhizon TaxID=34254 RepID=A0AAV3Q1Q9_LITER